MGYMLHLSGLRNRWPLIPTLFGCPSVFSTVSKEI